MSPTGARRPLRWRMIASHVPADGAGGGMVRYVVELAAALARRSDIELSVVADPAAVDFFADLLGGPDRVVRLPGVPVVGQALLEHLTTVVEGGADLDVVHGTKHLLPLRSRATRVLTVHDLLPYDRPQDFGPLKRATLRGPYRLSVARADALLCDSEATRVRLVTRMPRSASRATTVPLAMSSQLLAVPPEPPAALAGRRFALVVGDDSYRKNLGTIVDAWPDVLRREPDLVLAVAGPSSWAGSDRGSLYDRLTAAGQVVALGRVPDAELRWCYENAEVTLCPSLLEGFGLPAVEAVAFGSPLLTSTDPALVEASGPDVTHLPPDRPGEWVEAIAQRSWVARTGVGPTRPIRTWDEVAADTVAAARAGLR